MEVWGELTVSMNEEAGHLCSPKPRIEGGLIRSLFIVCGSGQYDGCGRFQDDPGIKTIGQESVRRCELFGDR